MMKKRFDHIEKHSQESQEDTWLEQRLEPLRELLPPSQLRLANRRRIQAVLGELAHTELTGGAPWWRRRIAVPIPLAIAAAFALGAFAFWHWYAHEPAARSPQPPATQNQNVADVAPLPATSDTPATATLPAQPTQESN